MSEIYIVAGPPRSGTSVTAGILHNLGVPMGLGGFLKDNIADDWNSRGQFADREFYAFCGTRLPLLSVASPTWSPDEESSAEIADMLSRRMSYPKWGIKGPHSYAAAPLLLAMGLDVRLVVTDRPLEQSQASFVERTGDDLKADGPDWVSQIKDRVEAVWDSWPENRRLRVMHADIYDATEATVTAIAEFCGQAVTQEAIDIVDMSARRFG